VLDRSPWEGVGGRRGRGWVMLVGYGSRDAVNLIVGVFGLLRGL
jgi:hypothetical protein